MGRPRPSPGGERDETQGHLVHETQADDGLAGDEIQDVGAGEHAGHQVAGDQGHAEPGEIDWAARGVDVVVESSGKFRTPESIQPHFDRGARKVVVAAPVKEGALNLVMGCNDDLYDPETHHLVTAASCRMGLVTPPSNQNTRSKARRPSSSTNGLSGNPNQNSYSSQLPSPK